jgi:hypothetical protein
MIACHIPKEPYLLLSGFEHAAASTDKYIHTSTQARLYGVDVCSEAKLHCDSI